MQNGRRSPHLILIEFNELCPQLLDRFVGEGQLPNFERLHRSSKVYTTHAAESPPNLEPWIQWPTVHSGLDFAEHGVFHLGDGKRLSQKCIGQVMTDAGLPVGICMSMNLNYRQLRGYMVPDPWDTDGVAFPDRLRPFYQVIARQVQESSKEEGLSSKELRDFGMFLLRNGITLRTVRHVLRHLLDERRDPGVSWRRASILDHLAYDVFRSLNRRFGVQFATFFANSTAHYQHYFWRDMEPELFVVKPAEDTHPSRRDAIPYGYRSMDMLVGRLFEDYPDSTLVLCTALSQQPWTDTAKCTFRPRSFVKFLEFAQVDLPASAIKPVMAEQFHLQCSGTDLIDGIEARMRALKVDDEPLMHVKREVDGLFLGCRLMDARDADRIVRNDSGKQSRLGDLFQMIHSMRAGRHHPSGAFWIQSETPERVETEVPLRAVAPTLLQKFGISPPAYMTAEPLPV